MTPEEAKQIREQRASVKAKLKELTQLHKISFYRQGIYTIAYKRGRRDLLELSTAIRHPNDKEDVITGKLLAAERFAAGNTIILKKSKRDSPSTFFMYLGI
jgi:NOL1/NOP2/fmu family ribosome biogenesis protein